MIEHSSSYSNSSPFNEYSISSPYNSSNNHSVVELSHSTNGNHFQNLFLNHNNNNNNNKNNHHDLIGIGVLDTEEHMKTCFKLNLIAIYCIFLCILSLYFNIALLKVFYNNSDLRTSLNLFIIVLTALNLLGTCIELPLVIITNFSCK
jgi:hypothetical protein